MDVKQFAEEKVGRDVEKTRFEADMEHLIDLQDKVKNHTEKMVRSTENVLQPNPSKLIDLKVELPVQKKNKKNAPTSQLVSTGSYQIKMSTEATLVYYSPIPK